MTRLQNCKSLPIICKVRMLQLPGHHILMILSFIYCLHICFIYFQRVRREKWKSFSLFVIEEKVGRWDGKREINYSWRKVKETGSCSVRALVTDRTSAQYCSTFLNYLTFAHFCPAFSSSICQCNACSFFSFLFGFSFSPPYLHLMVSSVLLCHLP